ncbi:MAG: hypothetical protein CMJ75_02805 [Planctomycetaceae bacterium]|nr:hypothetical protein [Planctomycetaceae bacterium]
MIRHKYVPSPKEKFIYLIDIVGTCNLRCPSCPVGNYTKDEYVDSGRSRGMMSVEKFDQILHKIEGEKVAEEVIIGLYNWGEPTLHPDLPAFIKKVKEYGFTCNVSSNFNLVDLDIGAIVRSAPDFFRISVSGYRQEVYQQTHTKGNIYMVLSNLHRLRYFMDRLKKEFEVEVYFHLYRHNLDDVVQMKKVADDLNFAFEMDMAYFMGLGKILKYLDGGALNEKDAQVNELMILSHEERTELAWQHKDDDCHARSHLTTINWDGSVALCCATYEASDTIANDFNQFSHDELQEMKYSHATCEKCTEKAQHVVAAQEPKHKLAEIGNQRIKELMNQTD